MKHVTICKMNVLCKISIYYCKEKCEFCKKMAFGYLFLQRFLAYMA